MIGLGKLGCALESPEELCKKSQCPGPSTDQLNQDFWRGVWALVVFKTLQVILICSQVNPPHPPPLKRCLIKLSRGRYG